MTQHLPSLSTWTRRAFLKSSSAASLAALALPAKAQGSGIEKVRLGLIGCGPQGHNSIRFTTDWFQTVAVCDVDQERRERSRHLLTKGSGDAYNDYRAILDREDIRAVYIATPDHWRAKILIEAMRAGKDVFAEKPLTLTIDEGKQVKKIQAETGRVVQVGTQQRSMFDLFTKAIAMVQQGRLGKIKRIHAAIDGGGTCNPLPVVTPPKTLDWDRWLGPAPKTDYRYQDLDEVNGNQRWATNCRYHFRWWYQYSGGKLTDWGAHHVDIACWALEANGQSNTPISISGMAKTPVPYEAGFPTEDDRYNMPHAYNLSVNFKDDVELVIRSDTANGVLIEGEKGRIFVNRGKLVGKPVEDLENDPLPDDAIDLAYRGMAREKSGRTSGHKSHWFNFYNCMQSREQPISDITSHMRALNICHLSNIAARLGEDGQARPLSWDEETGTIAGDPDANAMLKRESRAGYEIEV